MRLLPRHRIILQQRSLDGALADIMNASSTPPFSTISSALISILSHLDPIKTDSSGRHTNTNTHLRIIRLQRWQPSDLHHDYSLHQDLFSDPPLPRDHMPTLPALTHLRAGLPLPHPRPRPSKNPPQIETRRSKPSTSTDGILTSRPRSPRCRATLWISTRPVPWCWMR